MFVILGWWFIGYYLYDEFEPVAPASIAIAGSLSRMIVLIGTPLRPACSSACRPEWCGSSVVRRLDIDNPQP